MELATEMLWFGLFHPRPFLLLVVLLIVLVIVLVMVPLHHVRGCKSVAYGSIGPSDIGLGCEEGRGSNSCAGKERKRRLQYRHCEHPHPMVMFVFASLFVCCFQDVQLRVRANGKMDGWQVRG